MYIGATYRKQEASIAGSGAAYSKGRGVAVPETVGERIKLAMKNAGLGNQDLAEAIGVSAQAVSDWRNNRAMPKDENFEAMSEVLNRPVAWLRYGTRDALRVGEESQTTYNAPGLPAKSSTPQAVRRWLAEFRLKLVDADVPDEAIDEAIDVLSVPSVQKFFSGVEEREDKMIQWLEATSEDIIEELESRGFRFDE